MYLLDIEALDLGAEVRSVGLELVGADENREPVRGADAARIWSRVLQATAGQEAWALDFFSHIDRVRDYCKLHDIAYREANQRSIVVPAPKPAALESLLERFEGETFGARAGALVAPGAAGDPASKRSWHGAEWTRTAPFSRTTSSALSARSRMGRSSC